jgi:hypothetical protein
VHVVVDTVSVLERQHTRWSPFFAAAI